jgi:hypothetical protein
MADDTTSTINDQAQTTKESSKKNAFKIKFGKGVKLTASTKKELNDTIGCHYDSIHQAYVCPIEKRDSVTAFLKESKIEAGFVDVFDINKEKKRKIISLENRIEILQKKTHEEDMRLLSEIAQYDTKRSSYDFEEPPIFENLPEDLSEEW